MIIFHSSLALSSFLISGVSLAELILCLALLRSFILKHKLRLPRLFFILNLFWLLLLIVSSIYNETKLFDFLRVFIGHAVFLSCCIYVYSLRNIHKKLFSIILAYTLGSWLSMFTLIGQYNIEFLWKSGLGWSVALSLILIGFYLQKNMNRTISSVFTISGLFILSVISVALGSRSLGAILFLTIVLIFTLSGRTTLTFKQLIKLSVITMICVFISFLAAVNLNNELDGNQKTSAFSLQGLIYTLVLSRPELIISLPAILENPLLGHGPWAKNSKYFSDSNLSVLEITSGGEYSSSRIEREKAYWDQEQYLIPTHSHLLVGLVWTGFAGLLFWVFMLSIAIGNLLRSNMLRAFSMEKIIVLLFSTKIIWDICFSMYSSTGRVRLLMLLFFTYTLLVEMSEREK